MKLIKLLNVFVLLFFVQNVASQNVMISNYGTPCEPSIAIDPNNTNRIVAGAVINYRYTSNNGGLTWDMGILKSQHGVWGDPVIDIDQLGNFYYFHLSNSNTGNFIDRIVCQKSTDGGYNWSSGTFTGLNGAKAQDKHWTIIDKDNNIYMTWTEFDKYGSNYPSHKSKVMFSKSLDQGETWSDPVKINLIDGNCHDDDGTTEGAVPAVGPLGEVYVAWAGPNGLVFNRSTDQGETWLNKEIPIDPQPGGWVFSIPGLQRAGGLPVIQCDLSRGEHHGTIYVNWTDQRNGADNTDVWLAKSTDGGDTWSKPIRVNTDNSNKHQFFSSMDIDQINGNIYFVFYDRRAYSSNDVSTDVYLAVTRDGGETFENRKISERPFRPTSSVFFGDYNDISAHNNVVRPIWTRLDGGKLSVWTDVTPIESGLGLDDQSVKNVKTKANVYPTPTLGYSYISFKLRRLSTVKLELVEQNGKLLATVLDNVEMGYAKHIIPINTKEFNLSPGVYYYRLTINGEPQTLKTILVE